MWCDIILPTSHITLGSRFYQTSFIARMIFSLHLSSNFRKVWNWLAMPQGKHDANKFESDSWHRYSMSLVLRRAVWCIVRYMNGHYWTLLIKRVTPLLYWVVTQQCCDAKWCCYVERWYDVRYNAMLSDIVMFGYVIIALASYYTFVIISIVRSSLYVLRFFCHLRVITENKTRSTFGSGDFDCLLQSHSRWSSVNPKKGSLQLHTDNSATSS